MLFLTLSNIANSFTISLLNGVFELIKLGKVAKFTIFNEELEIV
jgi:hypothetical protein